MVRAGPKVQSDRVTQRNLRGRAVHAVRHLFLADPCCLAPPKLAMERPAVRVRLVGQWGLAGRSDLVVHLPQRLRPDRVDYAYSE